MAELTEKLIPEDRLMVLAARLELGPRDADELNAILRERLDWSQVLGRSQLLGVGPLLYRHLAEPRFAPFVPPEVLAALKGDYQLQAIRMLRVYGLLRRLLHALDQGGIRVILLKGAFLAKWVYQDIALRPMVDIDLLCRPEDLKLVEEKLAGLGLTPLFQGIYSPLHEEIFGIHAGHPPPYHHPRLTRVEVHTSLFPEASGDSEIMTEVWATCMPHKWDGLVVQSLSVEHQVLYLANHLFSHATVGTAFLYWFCDLHEIITRHQGLIGWEGVWRLANEIGIAAQVRSILGLLKDHWHTPLPEIQGDTPQYSLSEILRPEKRSKRSTFGEYVRILKMTGDVQGWRNRGYFLAKLIFPSRAYMMQHYQPRSSLTLYLWYVAHPAIRVWRAVESLFHHGLYRLEQIIR